MLDITRVELEEELGLELEDDVEVDDLRVVTCEEVEETAAALELDVAWVDDAELV